MIQYQEREVDRKNLFWYKQSRTLTFTPHSMLYYIVWYIALTTRSDEGVISFKGCLISMSNMSLYIFGILCT